MAIQPLAEEDVLEPVAIIGLSLKFPQDATSPEALWAMLLSGSSTSTEVPSERFHSQSFYHKDPSNVGSVCFAPLRR
jgi:acyl transferase domain-containing protein